MPAWRGSMAWSWVAVMVLVAGCTSASSSGPRPASEPATSAAAAASAPTGPATGSAGEPLWLQSVQMSTASTGWALYYPANPGATSASPPLRLARTTDGARAWTDVTPPAARQLLASPSTTEALYTVSGTRAYLAVNAGKQIASTVGPTDVFATDNGGRTWTESPPVIAPGYASALNFADRDHGWLLISEGAAMDKNPVQVYRTTDGGAHWSLTAQSPPWLSKSTAGLPATCDKRAITFASTAAGWLTSTCTVGLSGELLVSRDGGVTWTPQPLPLPAGICGDSGCSMSGPQFSGDTGFLTVAPAEGTPTLLVSQDLGQTWQPVSLPAGAGRYPQLKFFGPARGVLVSAGSQGSVGSVFYTTSDGGRTWSAVPQGTQFTQFGATIDFVSPLTGFAWMPGGDAPGAAPPAMYETTDSGRTWTPFTPLLAA